MRYSDRFGEFDLALDGRCFGISRAEPNSPDEWKLGPAAGGPETWVQPVSSERRKALLKIWRLGTLDELQFLRLYTDCHRSLRNYATEAWRLFEMLDPRRAPAPFKQQQLELTRQWDLEVRSHKAYLRCRAKLLQAAGVLPSKK
jgi:hypothetical protein